MFDYNNPAWRTLMLSDLEKKRKKNKENLDSLKILKDFTKEIIEQSHTEAAAAPKVKDSRATASVNKRVCLENPERKFGEKKIKDNCMIFQEIYQKCKDLAQLLTQLDTEPPDDEQLLSIVSAQMDAFRIAEKKLQQSTPD